MPTTRPFALLLALTLLGAAPSACTRGADETDRQILQQLAAIRDDIDELKAQVDELQSQPAPAPTAAVQPRPTTSQAPIQTAGHPALGRPDAPVTVVEFSDYQCPFCRRHNTGTMPQIRKDYVDTGKVRYVFVDNPIPSHRYAAKAAEAAHCAGDQGKYWEMHDHLFSNQHRITPDALPVFAQEIGLDTAAFKRCLDAGVHAAEVAAGGRLAAAAGARGTPSFVIGKTRPDGTVSGDLIVGAKAFPVFADQFAKYLAD